MIDMNETTGVADITTPLLWGMCRFMLPWQTLLTVDAWLQRTQGVPKRPWCANGGSVDVNTSPAYCHESSLRSAKPVIFASDTK